MVDYNQLIDDAIRSISDFEVFDDIIPDEVMQAVAIREMPSGDIRTIKGSKREYEFSLLIRVEQSREKKKKVRTLFEDLDKINNFKTSNFNNAFRDEQYRVHYEFTLKIVN